MNLCPFCGAYNPEQCELEEEAGGCPWEDADDLLDAGDDSDLAVYLDD